MRYKFIYLIIISIILVSIGYFMGLEFNNKNTENQIEEVVIQDENEIDKNLIKEVIILQGKNENWSVEGYRFIKYEEKVQFGSGKIKYFGSKENLDNVVFYEFDILKYPLIEEGKVEVLYSESISGANMEWKKSESTEKRINSTIYENDIKRYEGNISSKRDYNFTDNYIVKAKVKFQYKDGKEVEEEFPLNIIVTNNHTFDKVDFRFKSE